MDFSDSERLFLRTICRYFHEHAAWPTYDYLDAVLGDRDDLDVEVIGQKLERFMYDAPFAPMAGWSPERQTVLNIPALHTCLGEEICPEIAEDLNAFVEVFQLALEKYRARSHDNVQSAKVSAAEVRERFQMTDLMLLKVFELFSRTGLMTGSTGPNNVPGKPAEWTFTVSPNIRKYRKVTTVDDYVRTREASIAAERERYRAVAPQMLVTETTPRVSLRPISLFPAGPFTRNDSLCFVLMPFALEMQPVYDKAIVPAVTQAGLICQRADEIMKPGGIMAQVWMSLMQARAVIADLTQMNANVFYELGLAHAIGHNAILLTQDKKWVPFDLQHMRWIRYTMSERGLLLLRQQLKQFLTEELAD